MKPREFWLDLNINEVLSSDSKRESNDVYVREVVEIDWEKVWALYPFVNIFKEGKNKIQELVEKQLRGENEKI